LKQFAQRDQAVSILGDIQYPTGHRPRQPTPAGPAFGRGLD